MQMKAQCDVYSREALISAIEAHDIISFDIFDTLVMRNVYVNKDVFRLLAREIDPVWGVDFFAARTEAEFTLSRETYPYIEEIYADVIRRCPCLAGQEEALIRRELELERSLIIPRHDVVEIFNQAKDMGKMVNIVSDMYFRQDTIRSILEGVGITGYDKLLVSSEYNSSKPQHLFDQYLAELPEGSCLHIGDSQVCDIVPAGKLGIDTFRLKMSTEIYEQAEQTAPPEDLDARTQVARYVAQRYNSPFEQE